MPVIPHRARRKKLGESAEPPATAQPSVPASSAGGKNQRGTSGSAVTVLTNGTTGSTRMVGGLDHAQVLLAWLVATTPTSYVAVPPPTA